MRFSERFRGPPGIVNGGLLAGTLAERLGGATEVTLRKPVPVDTTFEIHESGDEVTIRAGDDVFVSARAALPEVSLPEPVSWDEATNAVARSDVEVPELFLECFVCGTARSSPDSLGLRMGAIDDAATVVASPWQPDARLCADIAGAPVEVVPLPLVYAALDCPGVWSIMLQPHFDPVPMLLGRITGEVLAPVAIGERHVVLAWALPPEGRKQFCGTAVFDEGGNLCASARSTWFTFG